MARAWRIQYADAIYRVMWRGNRGEEIFFDDADRHDFQERLGRASERFHLKLLAFCLMSNHYHLFLRTREANLAAAMKWLNATYSSRFNRCHTRSGHVFQGRYKSALVGDEAHRLRLSIYLHLNPARAGLVGDPGEYEWSSFRDYTRRPRFPWLAVGEVLSVYGRDEAGRRRRSRREVLARSGRPASFWEGFRSKVVLGSREAITELVKKHRPAGKIESVPAFKELSRPAVKAEEEIARLGAAFGVQREELLRPRRNFPPRLAADYHLGEVCGFPGGEVGRMMGVSGAAVSMGIKKFRETMRSDERPHKIMSGLNL